jgi:hypothetical protein
MIIGSLKEVFLTRARDVFLFDWRVAGVDPDVVDEYRAVLNSFITFAGDIRVRQLRPDHIQLYIANLSDGPGEGDEHEQLVMNQYVVIHTWIHWMYSQKFIIERSAYAIRPPRLETHIVFHSYPLVV